MKFKVGDIVRPTREYIINAVENNTIYDLEYINSFQVLEIKDDRIFYYINEKDAFYKAEHLELVPEEPEFEYGKIIEVSNDNEHWLRRMFIAKSNRGNYIGIDCSDPSSFVNGRNYSVGFYRYARKLRPQLTRKEIAEKFRVSEDFTLVD